MRTYPLTSCRLMTSVDRTGSEVIRSGIQIPPFPLATGGNPWTPSTAFCSGGRFYEENAWVSRLLAHFTNFFIQTP